MGNIVIHAPAYSKVGNRGGSIHENGTRDMMTVKEGMLIVKRMIETDSIMPRALLLKKISDGHHMAKGTAEKCIECLIERGEISKVTVKKRQCFMLTSGEAYRGDLQVMFVKKYEALKEKLDLMEEGFERHSYDAQQHMYDEFLGNMEDTVKMTESWIEILDKDIPYEAEHEKIGSNIRNHLEGAKIVGDRKSRILRYAAKVVLGMNALAGSMGELTEAKNATRQSAEREQMKANIGHMNKQLHVLYSDTVNLESALKEMASLDITYWLANPRVERMCRAIEYARKRSVEHIEAMSRTIDEFERTKSEYDMSGVIKDLQAPVLSIKENWNEIERVVKKIETAGAEHESIKKLDSVLANAESHLNDTNAGSKTSAGTVQKRGLL